MKRIWMLSALAAVGLGGVLAYAEELIVPAFERKDVEVASGEAAVQEERTLVDEDGELRKTGAGDLMIRSSVLSQKWPFSLKVLEGGFELGFGTSAGDFMPPKTPPTDIMNKALLWVDSSTTNNMDMMSASRVAYWYDCREENKAFPHYCYCKTMTDRTTGRPTVRKVDSLYQSVYFGGWTSKRYMRWMNPKSSGSSETYYSTHAMHNGVKHVFVAHSISKTFGQIIGGGSAYSDFQRDTYGQSTSTVGSSLNCYLITSETAYNTMVSGRFYVNGSRIDPTVTKPSLGRQVWEMIPRRATDNWWNTGFFNTENTSGGDDLFEVVVFTNQLTEAERVQVSDYLMNKWCSDRTPGVRTYDLAGGTTMRTGSLDEERGKFDLAGKGTVEKTGEGEYAYKSWTGPDFDGEIDVQDGSARLLASAAVTVKAGECVTASNLATGLTIVRTAADSGSVIKRGNGRAIVHGMPKGVRKLAVDEGTLCIAPRHLDEESLSQSYYDVEVPDAGFENFAAIIDAEHGVDSTDGTYRVSSTFVGDAGWISVGGATCNAINWHKWTGPGKYMDNVYRSTWNLHCAPPEGKCMMVLKAGSTTQPILRSKDIVLAEDGSYELTFSMGGRQDATYAGMVLQVYLEQKNDMGRKFGQVIHNYLADYTTVRFRLDDVPAGTYQLRFQLLTLNDLGGVTGGIVALDDLHLRKVPTDPMQAKIYKIPYGDFERPNGMGGYKSGLSREYQLRTMCVEKTLPEWQFLQTAKYSAINPDVGLVNFMTTNADFSSWGYCLMYSDSRQPANGSCELLFQTSGARAQTTFTPPAGVWALQADLARIGSFGVNPALTVTATVNGVSIELGKVQPSNKIMMTKTWPVSFETDGSEEVTLDFYDTQESSGTGKNVRGVVLDDVRLVKDELGEDLFGDRGLTGLSSMKITQRVINRSPSESKAAFGTNVLYGTTMMTVGSGGSFAKNVYLKFAGRYRFSFYAHSRLNAKDGSWGVNPLVVFVVDPNGVTNDLGYADCYNSDWQQYTYDYRATEPGCHYFGLRSTYVFRSDLADWTKDVGSTKESFVNLVTVKKMPDADYAPPFAYGTRLEIADGAKLELDFTGTNVIESLHVGDKILSGVVDVKDLPGVLYGRGTFLIKPSIGFMMLGR